MTCSFCKHKWCWLCGSTTKRYTYLHFLAANPFGCQVMGQIEVYNQYFFLNALVMWILSPLLLGLNCLLLSIILTFYAMKWIHKKKPAWKDPKSPINFFLILLFWPFCLLACFLLFIVTVIPVFIYQPVKVY
jgi:hypothetical protein